RVDFVIKFVENKAKFLCIAVATEINFNEVIGNILSKDTRQYYLERLLRFLILHFELARTVVWRALDFTYGT
ncbi:MAG: hypothetical protein AAGJ18_31405, partial [Bacteroidota bacterium]